MSGNSAKVIRLHAGRRRAQRAFRAVKSGAWPLAWAVGGGDLNEDLRQGLDGLRARARELEENSDWARRFLSLVETHVVGPRGFTLQVRGRYRNGKLDAAGNEAVEEAFAEWSAQCEITGTLTFVELERLVVRAVARDGEALVRLHDLADHPHGFALELLDVARLDTQLGHELPNGNQIVMGVELAPSGRPAAYWLKVPSSGFLTTGRSHVRVPAEDVIHLFRPERPEQVRGVPWMCAAMRRMARLEAYEDAAVEAAELGALRLGFYKAPDGDLTALGDPAEDGGLEQEVEGLHIGKLPAGYDFEPFETRYPDDAFGPFVNHMLHNLATGLGVSYAALTGDLTKVNFSSMRSGALEEREHWKTLQDWFERRFLRRVYQRWLSSALAMGAVPVRGIAQDEAVRRYGRHAWQGRRWPWVDPEKDMDAAIRAMAAGLRSPQQVAAELGVDPDQVLEQIARYLDQAQSLGVTVDWAPRARADRPPPQEGQTSNATA